MKIKKSILDRGQDYKFENLHYVKGVNHIWNDAGFMKIVKSAFVVYNEGNPQQLPTSDKLFCDHFAKKCNGNNAVDKAVAIETLTLISCLTHANMKTIRAKYGYLNRDIMRAVTGRPVAGSAAVGNKAVQAEQVDNIINLLRAAVGKQQSHVEYKGGKLSSTNTSDSFSKLAKIVHSEHRSLNDRMELVILKQAIAINARIDAGTLDKSTFKPIRKTAPKTAKTAQSKTA